MSIIDSFKTASSIVVKVHDADIKAEIQAALLNAQGEALELQARVATLQEENVELHKDIEARKHAADLADKVFLARHAIWMKDNSNDAAFCPTCWQTTRKLVSLMKTNRSGFCHACKAYHDFVYVGPKPKMGESAVYSPTSENYGIPRTIAEQYEAGYPIPYQ